MSGELLLTGLGVLAAVYLVVGAAIAGLLAREGIAVWTGSGPRRPPTHKELALTLIAWLPILLWAPTGEERKP